MVLFAEHFDDGSVDGFLIEFEVVSGVGKELLGLMLIPQDIRNKLRAKQLNFPI